ncbi:serine/threonine-protein kinase [Rhizohabitans arisaemae]|uniref:serine/threonine-protein kinase n=1 Tax=Rhizohabitans arisaemae TaxID=2720610 RepID=UPI0024B0B3F1|nr:serine/threonine-protein kinase [Rhizohabitans arisaemae]
MSPFEPLREFDPQVVGGYRLRARLGAGGMGQVFLSFTPGGRAVAVKVLRQEFADDPEFRARFAQEVRSAQQVNGVHIAQLLDAGTGDDQPWMATAYVPGPSLGEAVRLAGPLPVPQVQALTVVIARALQAIHEAGIIHRDLKPGNVVLCSDVARVIDFGVARAADATALTVSGMRVGTPQYTAPEQIQGRSATPAADVFALGAVAYYAATGKHAFGEGPEFSVVHRVVYEEPSLEGCPPSLLALVRSCLSKDPEARPALQDVIDVGGSAENSGFPPPVVRLIEERQEAVDSLSATTAPSERAPAAQTGARPEPRREPGNSGPARRAGWLPVVVTAVVVSLITALTVTQLGGGDPERDPQAVQTGQTVSTTSAPTTAPPPSTTPPVNGEPSVPPTPTPSPSPGDVTQWTGRVKFDFDGIDLDSVPPSRQEESFGAFDIEVALACGGSCALSDETGRQGLARWPTLEPPTRAKCAELVSTQGDSQLGGIKRGDLLCLRTSMNRIALVAINSFVDENVDATVIVWAATDESG